MGAYLNLNSLGLVLEISLSTSSLQQGIHFLDNYLKQKFPIVALDLSYNSTDCTLRLSSEIENRNIKEELLNMVLYIIYRELKLMMPKGQLIKLSFPFAKKEDIRCFFEEEVAMGASHQILLPLSLIDQEINLNRVREVELLLPKFMSLLGQSNEKSGLFAETVREMILRMCNPEIPNLKQVLKQFACSERTFQRKLAAEGSTFRKIVLEIKEELSHYLSNEKHLKIKDIAYILGYSESSAYLHALKRW